MPFTGQEARVTGFAKYDRGKDEAKPITVYGKVSKEPGKVGNNKWRVHVSRNTMLCTPETEDTKPCNTAELRKRVAAKLDPRFKRLAKLLHENPAQRPSIKKSFLPP